MESKVEINRLSQDELEYELQIRGAAGTGTVDEMRRILRRMKKLATSSSFVMPKHPFTFAQDVAGIKSKLAEVKTLVNDFAESRQSSAYKKISSKLAFLQGRINRSVPSSPEETAQRSKLLVEAVELSSSVSSKAKTFERTSTAANVGLLDLSLLMPSVNSGTDSDSDSSSVSAPVVARVPPKPVPVSAWGLKFSGSPKELSLSAFIERVNELKMARHSSDEILFRSAVDLFTGNALIWYRANKAKFSSWSELMDGLRTDFQTPSYDENLYLEITQRTQGATETMGLYVSVMKNLFSRLSVKVSESAQLRVIMRNIHPFYQSQLGLIDVTSCEQLLKLSRQLEARRARIESFVPPPNHGKVMEPDLAYVGTSQVTNVSAVEPPKQGSSSSMKCWNCGQKGHRYSQCKRPRKRHCFSCGKPNVTTLTCPTCSGKGRAMH